MTNQQQQQQQQLSTYTRSELSNIPVFTPKQRYDVYSRNWTASSNQDNNDESNPLPVSTNQIIKNQKTSWHCILLSVFFTVLFYAVFLAAFTVIAVIIFRLGKEKSDDIEMMYKNRTSGVLNLN